MTDKLCSRRMKVKVEEEVEMCHCDVTAFANMNTGFLFLTC